MEEALKDICVGISQRYEINFVEIGSNKDHVHFLIQTVPMMRPKDVVQKIKSITARRIFRRHLEVRRKLWGSQFWTSGYCMNTVGQYANEKVIREYVTKQGKKYHQIYQGQLQLFEGVG